MADELDRWAARRAPELVARAEAEAAAELKAALLAAARAKEPRPPAPETVRRAAAPRKEEPAPESGTGWWVYGVAVDDPALPAGGPGVDPESEVRLVREAGLAALASPVPLAQFGTQALQRNLNDLGWLERVARAHEAVLDHALASTSIVPFRLCTIYEDERSVRAMLSEQREELLGTLDHLQDRQEWSVKLLVDAERLKAAASAESSEAAALEQELAARSAGGAYMLRRRLERHVRDLADQLGADIAHDVHARLQDWAADAVTNPAQNRELSRHQGEMLLNGAYLVEADKAAALQALVGGLEERYGELGARLELSGPWPPYNFIGRASRYVP